MGATGKTIDQAAIDQVLAKVSSAKLKELYDAVAQGALGANAVSDVVRDALVHRLNDLRPQKARRFFTLCFERWWSGDVGLLLAAPVPGFILRSDVAALWQVLQRRGLLERARTSIGVVDSATADRLINDILASDVGGSIRSDIAAAAVELIDAQRGGRQTVDGFLDEFIKERREGLRGQRRTDMTRSDAHDTISVMRGVLAAERDFLPLATKAWNSLSAPASAEKARVQATKLWIAIDFWRDRGGHDQIEELLPLALLHRHRRIDLIGEMIGLRPVDPALRNLTLAVNGHFIAASEQALEILSEITARVGDDGPLDWNADSRHALARQFDWLVRLFATADAAGLFAPDIGLARLHEQLTRFSRLLGETILPAHQKRTIVALKEQRESEDFAAAIEIARRFRQWQRLRTEAGQSDDGLDAWRGALSKAIGAALADLIREGSHRPATTRLAQLLRQVAIADAIGYDTAKDLPLTSVGLQKLVHQRLTAGDALHGSEIPFLARFVKAAREECEKTKSWQSSALSMVIEAASPHGF